MNRANQYIDIAVMDYIPAMLYTPKHRLVKASESFIFLFINVIII